MDTTSLSEAESSLIVHVALYSWLGNTKLMAVGYRDLGTLYRALGDREPADAMLNEAQRLEQELGI